MRAFRRCLGLMLLIPLSGCGASGPPQGELSRRARVNPQGTVTAGNTDFALRLYQQVRAPRGNLLFSPYSLSVALGMTYAGARGETERQMARTLRFELPPEKLLPQFRSLQDQLASRGSGAEGRYGQPFQLHIVNSLWGQRGFPFRPEFTDLLARHCGAGLRPVDFGQSESAWAAINQWASDETKGLIRDLVPTGLIDASTRLVLVNAVYLNAAWEMKFDPARTASGPFTLLDGTQIRVPLMHETLHKLRFAEGDGWQAVALPYSGRQLELLVLLPARDTFAQFEKALSVDELSHVLSQLKPHDVEVTFPKFRFASQFELAKALGALGMPDAFSGRADFSGMDGRRDLQLAAVVHKALINLDEEGTEAAAATAAVMEISGSFAQPMTFTADRPFLLLLRDVPTGLILFVGRVVDPR